MVAEAGHDIIKSSDESTEAATLGGDAGISESCTKMAAPSGAPPTRAAKLLAPLFDKAVVSS